MNKKTGSGKDAATTRCFFAVPLSEMNKSAVKTYVDSLKKYFEGCRVSWAKEGNLHITVWFLGNVSESILRKIMERAETALLPLPAFEFHMGFGGAFPDGKKPRVLWIAPDEGSEHFIKVRRALEETLSKLPVKKEKEKFFPHLTLGRVRALPEDFQRMDVYDANQGAAISLNHPFTQTVNEVCLFQSQLHPAGSVYTVLKKFALSAKAGEH